MPEVWVVQDWDGERFWVHSVWSSPALAEAAVQAGGTEPTSRRLPEGGYETVMTRRRRATRYVLDEEDIKGWE